MWEKSWLQRKESSRRANLHGQKLGVESKRNILDKAGILLGRIGKYGCIDMGAKFTESFKNISLGYLNFVL